MRCLCFALTLLLTGCASVQTKDTRTIAERYTTRPSPADNIDSLATWHGPEGQYWLFASAKDADNLAMFDAATGKPLRRVGAPGNGVGQLDRPNGITVIDDLLFVVERDNRRIQVFRLPELRSELIFGAENLQVPYGLWAHRIGREIEVLVSDSYQEADGSPPPLPLLAERIKRYRLKTALGQWNAQYDGAFGATDSDGALRWVESILGDPIHNRLLIAEEFLKPGSTIKIYDMAGDYTGQSLALEHFEGQAEGIAMWACDDGSGVIVATDQRDDGNRFQVFDRQTLTHLGAFAGRGTSNTDGIHIDQRSSDAFPGGAFFAVHDDQAVSAFDWRDINRELGLAGCD